MNKRNLKGAISGIQKPLLLATLVAFKWTAASNLFARACTRVHATTEAERDSVPWYTHNKVIFHSFVRSKINWKYCSQTSRRRPHCWERHLNEHVNICWVFQNHHFLQNNLTTNVIAVGKQQLRKIVIIAKQKYFTKSSIHRHHVNI